jgi:hypothetical protein
MGSVAISGMALGFHPKKTTTLETRISTGEAIAPCLILDHQTSSADKIYADRASPFPESNGAISIYVQQFPRSTPITAMASQTGVDFWYNGCRPSGDDWGTVSNV